MFKKWKKKWSSIYSYFGISLAVFTLATLLINAFISKPRRDDAMIASLEETTHKKTLTLTAKALKKKLSLNLRSLDVSYNLVWLRKKNGYA